MISPKLLVVYICVTLVFIKLNEMECNNYPLQKDIVEVIILNTLKDPEFLRLDAKMQIKVLSRMCKALFRYFEKQKKLNYCQRLN